MRDPSPGHRRGAGEPYFPGVDRRPPPRRGDPALRGAQLGQQKQDHPDERFIVWVADTLSWPTDLATAFDPDRSSINPFRWPPSSGSYCRQAAQLHPYGHFQLYLLAAVAQAAQAAASWSAAPRWLFLRLFSPSTPSDDTWRSTGTRARRARLWPLPIWGRCSCWCTRWGGGFGARRSPNGGEEERRKKRRGGAEEQGRGGAEEQGSVWQGARETEREHGIRNTQDAICNGPPLRVWLHPTPSLSCRSSSAISLRWITDPATLPA